MREDVLARGAYTHTATHTATHTQLHTLLLTFEALVLELYLLLLTDGASYCRALLTDVLTVIVVIVRTVPFPVHRLGPGRGEVRFHHANMFRFHAIPRGPLFRARNGVHGLHRMPTLAARDGEADRVRSCLPGKGNQPGEGGRGREGVREGE